MFKKKKKQIVEDFTVEQDNEMSRKEEAAKIMDCPAGTVKSRCSRGRAKLARRLQHLRNPDGHETVTPANGGERNGA